MRRANWLRYAAICGALSLLAPSTLALAQEAHSIAEILTGKTVPLSMKPADMPMEYKPVRIKVAGTAGGGGIMDMLMGMMSPMSMISGGGASGQDTEGAILMSLMDMSWTKGDVVKIQGKDFLLTYKWNVDLAQMMSQSKSEDAAQSKARVFRDMEFSLTLVAIDGLSSLSPVNGFTRDDLVKIIEKPMTPVETAPTQSEATTAAPEAEGDVQISTEEQRKTLTNIKQVATATMIYISDYDDVLPYAQSTKAVQFVTYPYSKNMGIWKTFNPNGGQFLYNISFGGSNTSAIEAPSETILFYESNAWPDGRRIVAFADAHAKILSAEEWSRYSPTLKLKLPKSAKPLPLKYGMDWNPGK